MKSTRLVTVIALAAAVFTVAAHAQTGRPSSVEASTSVETLHAVAADDEAGSYARYLMLNGATREEALASARNVDHPTLRNRVAGRSPVATDAKAPVRQ